jgi:hypothetical protein
MLDAVVHSIITGALQDVASIHFWAATLPPMTRTLAW